MGPQISKEVYDLGQELAAATGSDVTSVFNRILNRFLGWPFKAVTGWATDSHSQRTETFGTLIHTTSRSGSPAEPVEVPADALACAIDVSENIDLEHFHAAYERIACVKRLKKTPAPQAKGVQLTTITLGIIFAINEVVPVEKLAEALDRLNRQTPSTQWPDMVVLLSKGTINYAVQFPGEQELGEFLPPAEGSINSYIPPIYVIIVMRPTGAYTFNKMCSFLIAHLALFSPGAKLPNWAEVLRGTPKEGIALSGYQYNLTGQLLPVPQQFYNDRYIPPPPLRIEDRQGNLLSTLEFLPWQDGGVVLLRGKLPLEGLLIFLGKEALKGRVVRRPHAQISYVLPITRANFSEMVERIQKQSNMVVRRDSTKWVVQKFADEGSSSPFMARLFIGNLRLRDVVFGDPTKRDEFDQAYEFVIMTLLNTRTSSEGIIQMLAQHVRKVSQGEIARIHGGAIQIDESIDRELRKHVENFLNSAVRALKQGMQNVAKALQFDIGFLFQKPKPFATGVAALQTSDHLLAEYLREARKWSERLLDSRNAIEHKGWMLPRVTYSHGSGGIRTGQPQISGQPVSEFVKFMMDRLTCFVEEVTAHCLQARMPAGISVTEIPLSQRVSEMPERFQLTLASGGMPVWSITYHQSAFEET